MLTEIFVKKQQNYAKWRAIFEEIDASLNKQKPFLIFTQKVLLKKLFQF